MKTIIFLFLLLIPMKLFAIENSNDYYAQYEAQYARQEARKSQSMAVMSIDMDNHCKFCLANEETACNSSAVCDLCRTCKGFVDHNPTTVLFDKIIFWFVMISIVIAGLYFVSKCILMIHEHFFDKED